MNGSTSFSDEVTVRRGVESLTLHGTYPNPAHDVATVRYAIPGGVGGRSGNVTLRIYDVLGRQVRTLVNTKQEGRHEHVLDVRALPSGVYFLRLQARGEVRTQKLTVVQ